jgi:hypothetical protein
MYSFNVTSLFDTLHTLSSNKFILGIAMLMLNVGSKHLAVDMSKTQEQFFQHIIVRRITLFCIFFIATRDLFVSLILTAVFVVLAYGLSPYSSGDENDKKIFNYTRVDYDRAKNVIMAFESQNPEVHFCTNK